MSSNNNSGTSKVAAMKMMQSQQSPRYVHGTFDDSSNVSKVGVVPVESVYSFLVRKAYGRNELCPCKSGKKWKKCHGQLKKMEQQAGVLPSVEG